ncbi:MAG: AAA family ATPase, partial [Pseudonocardia sp.]|nr:AAA family ATPase [Pseudonocardia sp.]
MWRTDDPTFVGREAQLAALRSCAEDAEAGRARLVWIEGEAGAGKTALLDRAVDLLPATFTLVRAEADELGADVPFGLVTQLERLEATAPFAAGLELVNRWAQDDRPVAVVVEDLHWADTPSRETLLTAVRRLSRDRVLVIVTSRPGADGDGWERVRLDPRRCTRIEVDALTVEEVASLAAAFGVQLPRRAAERLHRHTGGHALYVRTLLAELEPARLADGDGELPAPRSLATTLIARLAVLPRPARDLAMGLAVIGRPAPLALVGAIAGVPDPTAALESLLAAGLVTWRTGPDAELRFGHPLYRAAVADDLSPTRGRELHRAAAELLGGAEALAHRMAATDGFDAELSAELADAAQRELDVGARERAARYWLWASAVEPVRERAERFLLDAVQELVEDGRPVRAAALRERVEACADSPRRELVRGMLDHAAGRGEAAARALRRAADEGSPDVVVAALAQLITL